jgi:hypothetical protein
MANHEKSFVTEWFLKRWIEESEKSRPENATPPVPPDEAKSRHLPVRFILGVNTKNVIVPIFQRGRRADPDNGHSKH